MQKLVFRHSCSVFHFAKVKSLSSLLLVFHIRRTNAYKKLASIFGKKSPYIEKSVISKFMTFSEFERVLNHCPHFTNFWLFLRVGEFCLFVLLTSRKKNHRLCRWFSNIYCSNPELKLNAHFPTNKTLYLEVRLQLGQ